MLLLYKTSRYEEVMTYKWFKPVIMCQPYASSVSVTLCFWYCTDWHFLNVLLNVLLCVSFLPQVYLERGTSGNHSNIHGPTPGKLSSTTTKEPEQPTQSRSGHVPQFTPLFPPHL